MRDILTLSSSRDGRPQQWNFGGLQPVNEAPPEDVAHVTAYVRNRQRRARIR